MASCITDQWSGNYSPQARLTVTQSSETETRVTLSWKLEYVAHGYAASTNNTSRAYTVKINGSVPSGGSGSFNIHGITSTKTVASGTVTINKSTAVQNISFSVSFTFNLTWSGVYKGTSSASGSISIKAKTSYTITYNANGGSGAPASQTKWHGTNLILSSTKPTRTGYSFEGWALTKANADSGTRYYVAGDTCGRNENLTLYATWKANTYAVKYNANGGSNAPGNQTKTYGVTLKLSTTKPTRTNYNFLGWATSASATTAKYTAGSNYTANSAVTLYAVWELAYTKPRIRDLVVSRAMRVQVDGFNTYEENEEGSYGRVSFSYQCDRPVESIKIEWESSKSETGSITLINDHPIEGKFSNLIIGNDDLSSDLTHTIRVIVTDEVDSTTAFATLSGTNLPIDVLIDVTYSEHLSGEIICERDPDTGDVLSGSLPNGTPVEGKFTIDTGRQVYAYIDENGETAYYTTVDDVTYYGVGYDGDIKGISFGKPAELEDKADFNYEIYPRKGFSNILLEPETDLNDVMTPNTYIGENTSTYNYVNCPISSGTFTLEVAAGGKDGQRVQTLTVCKDLRDSKKQGFTIWKRFYYNGDWTTDSNGKYIWTKEYDSAGTVLWSGGYYMTAGHEITLSQKISEQAHGIVLVFSEYLDETVSNTQLSDHFVSKYSVALAPGSGHNFNLSGVWYMAAKYLYIHDDRITGHEKNGQTLTVGGATFTNGNYVLRAVIGV